VQFDSSNPVVALCIAGIQVEGDAAEARARFERAWAIRQDDFDACVAAHYLARHQPDARTTLHWNEVALAHAERVEDSEREALLPSLCLNLGDSYLAVGSLADARRLAQRGLSAVEALPADGYREFIRGGLTRLESRVAAAESLDAATRGAEPALGDGPGRIYVVEPTGPIADDPNLPDKKFPGNPTK